MFITAKPLFASTQPVSHRKRSASPENSGYSSIDDFISSREASPALSITPTTATANREIDNAYERIETLKINRTITVDDYDTLIKGLNASTKLTRIANEEIEEHFVQYDALEKKKLAIHQRNQEFATAQNPLKAQLRQATTELASKKAELADTKDQLAKATRMLNSITRYQGSKPKP